jgi:diguanylate cyclase (GGDEF)-like protein
LEFDATHGDHVCRLQRLISLSLRDDIEAGLRELADVYGASDAALWLTAGDRVTAIGGHWPAMPAAELATRVQAAAATSALVRDGDIAWLGARLRTGERTIGALALGFSGAGPRLGCETLARFAMRSASELAHQARELRLAAAVSQWRDDPIRDELGAYSRSFVAECLKLEIARAIRAARGICVLVADIVGLRRINTQRGEEAGDCVLRGLDRIVRQQVRRGDIVGRWRDDTIAVVLPDTPIDAVSRIARAIFAAVAEPSSAFAQPGLRFSVQIGVAMLEAGERAEALLDRAGSAARIPDEFAFAPSIGKRDTAARTALAPGSIVGNTYRVLHSIGEGGGGRVYRAEDITLERPVALKILHPELAADPDLLASFRKEAALLAAIQHPSLVQVYTFGETPEGPYFAMELVEGETLGDSIARSQRDRTYLPIARLLACMTQIASALDRLHHGGVLHRDVKPENIVLDPFRERSILLDVGVAKHIGRGSEVSGTPGFVAPEIILGAPESPASDVFGLAVTAFQALTCRYPWASFDTEIQLVAKRSEPPRALSMLRPELAAADEVFRRGLAYDPADRLRTPGAFSELLAAALLPVSAVVAEPIAMRNSGPISLPPVSALGETEIPLPGAPSQTRGIVFKSIARVIGARELDELIAERPALTQPLSSNSSGLDWCDAVLFFDLLEVAAAGSASPAELARRLGRTVIRTSFQRFFPAHASTLTPEHVIASISTIWAKYHSWGKVRSAIAGPAATVALEGLPRRARYLAPWLEGMLAQTITLSGGSDVVATTTSEDERRLAVQVTWRSHIDR